jgi:UDPglucose--hexose-1-phosphate uridylyltransferase
VITQELRDTKRVVEENDSFVAITPFASRVPFEVWIIPKRHNCDFLKESPENLLNLAKIMKSSLLRIERVLDDPPLNYMLHSAPYMREREGYWATIKDDYHWHIEITPQVLELSGFEVGTGSHIQPLLPEVAAQLLREIKL